MNRHFEDSERRALCDSLPWEDEGRGLYTILADKPLPATSLPPAPLPREGIKNNLSYDGLLLSQEGNRTGAKGFRHRGYRSKTLLAGLICGFIVVSMLAACKPAIKETGAGLKYFDIKGYFQHDSARLTKLNKPVFKTVYHNGDIQSKKVHIDNWGTELSLFSESDINRPAWKDSYNVVNEGNILIYTAKDPDLKTREIMIKRVNGKLVYMLILNKVKNPLYTTEEGLTYFPDSLYQINKMQSVRLLGTNKYQIKGFFDQ